MLSLIFHEVCVFALVLCHRQRLEAIKYTESRYNHNMSIEDQVAKKKSAIRPALLWFGAIVIVMGNVAIEGDYANGYIASVAGIAAALIGCYLWTREKNRAWEFALWGLLAPIGYLGIMFLKDKTTQQS
jgi:Mg2+/citrate symporter